MRPISIAAAAMGTAGTILGLSLSLPTDTIVLGVRPRLGQRVPGSRDKHKMQVVEFEWESQVDHIMEMTRDASFIMMRRIWSEIDPQPGPTSGLACAGLIEHLDSLTDEQLENMRGSVALYLCPDDGRFYPAPTASTIDPDQGLVR